MSGRTTTAPERKAHAISAWVSGIVLLIATATTVSAQVTVRWDQPRQEIDGFGAAYPGAAMWIKNFREPMRSQVLDLLFSVTNGVGLSMVRCEINSGNHDAPDMSAAGAGRWQPKINSHQPTEGNWYWEGDEAQVWLMQTARARYGVTNFLSTVWSPPPWMKANNNYRGDTLGPNGERATLLTNKHQAYADYLSRYVREYKTRFGIDINAISIANEPGFPAPYQGMIMEAPQMVTFLRDFLKPTFVRDGVKARIVAPEDAHWPDTNRINAILADPGARAAVDIIANHGYDPSTQAHPAVTAAGKRLWMTEDAQLNSASTNTISEGLRWAKNIHAHLTEAETQAWIWWYAVYPALDNNPGTLLFLAYEAPWYQAERDTYRYPKRLWAIGNFSRFIRPGFRRIATEGNAPNGVYVSAYRSADSSQFVTVAINEATTEQIVILNTGVSSGITSLTPYVTSATKDLEPGAPLNSTSGMFALVLPPKSVTTFVRQPSPLPAAPTRDEWLSDLSPAQVSIAGIDPPQRDRSAAGTFWVGKTVSLGGTTHPKALGFSAPTRISYHLGRQAKRFTSKIALTAGEAPRNAVRFQVWGDDQMLFERVMQRNDSPVSVDVDVRGKRILTLVGLNAGPTGPHPDDQAVWASPRITHSGPRLIQRMNGDGTFNISLNVAPGETVVLERSSDFVNWSPVATSSIPSGLVDFNRSVGLTVSNGFYRARVE